MSAPALALKRNSNAFKCLPTEVIIIGIDTEHKSVAEHPLFDGERNKLPLTEEGVLNYMTLGCRLPVIVRKDEELALPVVVDGRQRIRYLREANARRAEAGLAPYEISIVLDKAANETDHMLVQESLNNFRIADSILTKAERAVGMFSRGLDMESMTTAFGVSLSSVKNFVRLGEADNAIKRALRDGKISPAKAYNLARLKTKAEQREALTDFLNTPADDPKDLVKDQISKIIIRAMKLGLAENLITESIEWGLAEGAKLTKKKSKKKKEPATETPVEVPASA